MNISSVGSISQGYQFFNKPVIATIAVALAIIASLGLYFLYRAFRSPADRPNPPQVPNIPLTLTNPVIDPSVKTRIELTSIISGKTDFFFTNDNTRERYYCPMACAESILSLDAESFQRNPENASPQWIVFGKDNRRHLVEYNGTITEYTGNVAAAPLFAVTDLQRSMDTYHSRMITIEGHEIPRVAYERAQQPDVDSLEVIDNFWLIRFKDKEKKPLHFYLENDATISQQSESSYQMTSPTWTWKNPN